MQQFNNKTVHDFMLAKQVVDELKAIAKEKNLSNIKKVKLEIGIISISHDGHPEHIEEINLENLKFGLESATRGEEFEKTEFEIEKVSGDNWKITDVEV